MAVKIISDSTCDLSEELLKKYDIAIAPLTVTLGDRSGHDGIDVGEGVGLQLELCLGDDLTLLEEAAVGFQDEIHIDGCPLVAADELLEL